MNAYRLKPAAFPWPPVLYGAAIAAAFVLGRLANLPLVLPGSGLRIAAGTVLVLAAMGLDLWALSALWRNHTTAMLHRPAARLVDDGPYRYTRNPVYLGYTMMTVGIGLMTGNPWFFLAVTAAGITSSMAIRCEEMHLLNRFGADYERYCRYTRRWI